MIHLWVNVYSGYSGTKKIVITNKRPYIRAYERQMLPTNVIKKIFYYGLFKPDFKIELDVI